MHLLLLLALRSLRWLMLLLLLLLLLIGHWCRWGLNVALSLWLLGDRDCYCWRGISLGSLLVILDVSLLWLLELLLLLLVLLLLELLLLLHLLLLGHGNSLGLVHLLLLLLLVVHLLGLVVIVGHSGGRLVMHLLLVGIVTSSVGNLVRVLLVHGLAWSRMVAPRHVGMGWQETLCDQPLNLLLSLPLVLQVLIVRVLGHVVDCVPLLVLLELGSFCLLDEFLVADQVVLVRVGLLEYVLPHTLHLLRPLSHVVLGHPRLIDLVQFSSEQRLYLQLIPDAVSVQVVHHEEGLGVKVLALHVVLFLPNLLQLRFLLN